MTDFNDHTEGGKAHRAGGGTDATRQPSNPRPLDMLTVLSMLWNHRSIVLGLPIAAVVSSLIAVLLLPNVYTARARILPPQQSSATSGALLAQLVGGGGFSGLAGIKTPSDLYVGMLRSDSISTKLIDRFNLKEVLGEDSVVQTREALDRVTTISAGKDGIITIEVDDESPERAAALANAYIEELEKANDRLAITEAAQRRVFFEKQLLAAKDSLATAETELRKTQERTGLIKLDDQGRAIIEAVAQLRAQVAAKQIEIRAMKSFATENNPNLMRAAQELAGLQHELKKVESDTVSGQGNVLVPTARVPEAGLEYIRKVRELKYHEAIFELMAKQYELARIDEAKDIALIQILDRATPPDYKSQPRRSLIVILAGFVATVLGIGLAILLQAHKRALDDPGYAARVGSLKAAILRNRSV